MDKVLLVVFEEYFDFCLIFGFYFFVGGDVSSICFFSDFVFSYDFLLLGFSFFFFGFGV